MALWETVEIRLRISKGLWEADELKEYQKSNEIKYETVNESGRQGRLVRRFSLRRRSRLGALRLADWVPDPPFLKGILAVSH